MMAMGQAFAPDIEFFSDSPAQSDGGLGFEKYADVISRGIQGTYGPFVIGIYGGWGNGKTTLMNIVWNKLHSNCDNKILTVWFDAWKYQQEEHLIIPFLTCILKAATKNAHLKNTIRGGSAAMRGIIRGSKLKFSLPGQSSPGVDINLKEAIETEEELRTFFGKHQKTFYGDIFECFSGNIANSNKKIAIFIDDLDRCDPKNAVKILEAIKLVFDHKNFIFVIGLTKEIIDSHIKGVYLQDYKIGDNILKENAYLDKIIQLPFEIPSWRHSSADFVDYLRRKSLSRQDKKLAEVFNFSREIWLFHDNPRAVIRFLNAMIMARSLDENIPLGIYAINLLMSRCSENKKVIEDNDLYLFLLGDVIRIAKDGKGANNKRFTGKINEAKAIKDEKMKDILSMTSEASFLEKEKKSQEILKMDPKIQSIIFTVEGVEWLIDENNRKKVDKYPFVAGLVLDQGYEETRKNFHLKAKISRKNSIEDDFLQAIRDIPDNYLPYYNYAKYLFQEKHDMEIADKMFQKAIDLGGRNPMLLNSYALFLAKTRRDVFKAEKLFQEAYDLAPNNPGIINNNALFLINQSRGNHQDIDKLFEASFRMDPNDSRAIYNYILYCINIKQDYAAAEILFKKAIEISPTDVYLFNNFALFCKNILNDKRKAENLYERAYRLAPNDVFVLNNYAIFAAEQGNLDKAESLFEQACSVSPKDIELIKNYALFKTDYLKDYVAAEILFKKALLMDPRNRATKVSYAKVLLIQDKRAMAFRYLKEVYGAISSNPKESEKALLLELLFYIYAFSYDDKQKRKMEREMDNLLFQGIRLLNHNLINLLKSAQKHHLCSPRVAEYASKITTPVNY